jgi:hypothetical protein
MRTHFSPAATTLCALSLVGCGPKTLELPQEPIERAATCGAVAAAAERAATSDFKAPLSFEGIGRVIHYPLLAGSVGDAFSSETAAQVQKRMTALQDSIVEGKWQDLVPVCKAAFPATAVDKVTLPADRFDAQLGCDELGDFLRSALEGQEAYVNDLAEYRDLGNKLEPALAVGLPASDASVRKERKQALAAMAKAGPPVAVMRQCLARFGSGSE